MHKIFTYGTLMPNDGRERVKVQGALYDLGWFPGLILSDNKKLSEEVYQEDPEVICEIIEVDDERLKELDHYEGYHEDDPKHSLYIRRKYLDGWLYEYNGSCYGRPLIQSGDWQAYKLEREKGKTLTCI